MFTPDEKRAIIFLAAVAVAGGIVRAVRHPDPPPKIVVAPELPGQDVLKQAALAREAAALARPLGPGETIDIDQASEREIERLPRIGPSLAQRIVADRDSNGPFGSLEALDQVSGVGPGILAEIRPHVRFSGSPRQVTEVTERKAVGRHARSASRAP